MSTAMSTAPTFSKTFVIVRNSVRCTENHRCFFAAVLCVKLLFLEHTPLLEAFVSFVICLGRFILYQGRFDLAIGGSELEWKIHSTCNLALNIDDFLCFWPLFCSGHGYLVSDYVWSLLVEDTFQLV